MQYDGLQPVLHGLGVHALEALFAGSLVCLTKPSAEHVAHLLHHCWIETLEDSEPVY